MRWNVKKIHWGDIGKHLFRFWLRHYQLLFFIFFLLLAIWSGYEWYRNLFTYQWSPEQRKTYLEKTIKETVFDQQGFLDVLERLEKRHQQYLAPTPSQEELFIQFDKSR